MLKVKRRNPMLNKNLKHGDDAVLKVFSFFFALKVFVLKVFIAKL